MSSATPTRHSNGDQGHEAPPQKTTRPCERARGERGAARLAQVEAQLEVLAGALQEAAPRPPQKLQGAHPGARGVCGAARSAQAEAQLAVLAGALQEAAPRPQGG